MKDNHEICNIILAGVGGQGNILASGIIGTAATLAGYEVTIGETYGASQRGGSVMSHIRIFQKEEKEKYGPLIPQHSCDVIVGFEPLETLRTALLYANCETRVVVNSEPVYPVSVLMGETSYPPVERILEILREKVGEVVAFNATTLSREVGDAKVLNMVMINALFSLNYLPIEKSFLDEALVLTLEKLSPVKREINRKAMSIKIPGSH